MASGNNKPNILLREERLKKGWTLEQLADELHVLCQRDSRHSTRGDINAQMISKWETGKHPPSLYYQKKLCLLFQKETWELGFLDEHDTADVLKNGVPLLRSSSTQMVDSNSASSMNMKTYDALPCEQISVPLDEQRSYQAYSPYSPSPHLISYQAIDHLLGKTETFPQHQVGVWLAVSAGDLTPLYDAQWTTEDILEALQVVLRGVKAMPQISRREFLACGAAAVVSGIRIPSEKRLSAVDRIQLGNALGENIGSGWKLFHTTGNAQVLAVGQAQLYLVQQASVHLEPDIHSHLYSGVYLLVGAALHLQGRHTDAYSAHNQAYLAALEGADTRNMIQSRIWQAEELKAQKRYSEASKTLEAALRLVSTQSDVESIRTKAQLLASSAENAVLMGDVKGVQPRLHASEELLEYLPDPHEVFDRSNWHQIAGICALHVHQYEHAVHHLEQAAKAVPLQWTLRQATTLMSLIIAYASMKERNASIDVVKRAIPYIRTINAPGLNKQFAEYTQCALRGAFPEDRQVGQLVADVVHQFLPPTAKA